MWREIIAIQLLGLIEVAASFEDPAKPVVPVELGVFVAESAGLKGVLKVSSG